MVFMNVTWGIYGGNVAGAGQRPRLLERAARLSRQPGPSRVSDDTRHAGCPAVKKRALGQAAAAAAAQGKDAYALYDPYKGTDG